MMFDMDYFTHGLLFANKSTRFSSPRNLIRKADLARKSQQIGESQ